MMKYHKMYIYLYVILIRSRLLFRNTLPVYLRNEENRILFCIEISTVVGGHL
jgi:hypothetical protein